MPSTVQEWRPVGGRVGLPLVDQVYVSSQEYPALPKLGTIQVMQSNNYGEGEFMFVKGVASCIRGSWLTINADDYSTALLAANAIGPVGIAMAAITASYYGWAQISGKALGACLTGLASNNRVWITGTAGKVDDASVAGDGVNLAKSASAIHVADPAGTTLTGLAEFEIHRPYTDDLTSFS